MNAGELQTYIEAAGGKRPVARLINISERYVDTLLCDDRTMSKELEVVVRLNLPKNAPHTTRER